MATVASIELVFNAKNNSKEAFRAVERGLDRAKRTAKQAQSEFASLGQNIEDLGGKSLEKLNQGLITVKVTVGEFATEASQAFKLVGKNALEVVRVIGQVSSIAGVGISQLNNVARDLGANNTFDLIGTQIETATLETRTFAEVLPAVAGTIKDLGAVAKNFSLRNIGRVIKEVGDTSFSPERRRGGQRGRFAVAKNAAAAILEGTIEQELRSILPNNVLGETVSKSVGRFVSSLSATALDALESGATGRRNRNQQTASSAVQNAFRASIGQVLTTTIGNAVSRAGVNTDDIPQQALDDFASGFFKGVTGEGLSKAVQKVTSGQFGIDDVSEILQSGLQSGARSASRTIGPEIIERFASIDPENVTDAALQAFAQSLPDGLAEDLVKKISAEGAQAFSPDVLRSAGEKALQNILPRIQREGFAAVLNNVPEAFDDFRGAVNSTLQDLAASGGRAGAELSRQFVREIPRSADALTQLRRNIDNLGVAVKSVGASIRQAFSLENIGRGLDVLAQVNRRLIQIPGQVGTGFVALGGALRSTAGYDEAIAVFDNLKQSAGVFAESVGNVSQQIFFFQSAFQSISQIAATGPFRLLIGQQVELRQQLLETQSTLTATNKIVDSFTGRQLNLPTDQGGNPAQAITALTGATAAAIDQLRKDSLELVGVTSRELAEVFNITTTGLASVGVETENILGDAADLTIKFSAALGTIGLPLFQARQEINSILQGTIDSNSALAKTLNITNQQVTRFKEQGTLVDELNKKLAAFQAGNAIAARSLSGVTSNLQEILEIVALQAGRPLLDPLLDSLNALFEFLSARQNTFIRFFDPIIEDLLRIQESIFGLGAAIGTELGATLANLPVGIINALANFIEQVSEGIQKSLSIFKPFLSVLDALIRIFTNLENAFGQSVIQLIVVGKVLQTVTGAFNLFLNLIPGIGELRFVLENGTKGIISQLVNIRNEFGSASSAALTFGLNFQKLATALPGVQQQLVKNLGAFGIFAPAITALIPKLSLLFIGISRIPGILTQLSKSFIRAIPQIQAFIAASETAGRVITIVATKIVGALTAVQAALAKGGLASLGGQLDDVIQAFTRISETGGVRGLFALGNEFSVVSDRIGKGFDVIAKKGEVVANKTFFSLSNAALKSAVTFGLWAIAIAGAGIALSEFLQRRRDAGAEIRGTTDFLQEQIDAFNGVEQAVDGIGQSNEALAEASILTKDWIDRIILLDRNFTVASLSFENFGESIISIGRSIVFGLARITAGVAGLVTTAGVFIGEFTFGLQKSFETGLKSVAAFATGVFELLKSPFDILFAISKAFGQAITGDLAGAQETLGEAINIFGDGSLARQFANEAQVAGAQTAEAFGDAFGNAANNLVGTAEAVFETGLGDLSTKVEDEIEELASAVLDPEFLENAREYGAEIRENLLPGDAEFKEIGLELSETLATVGNTATSAADRLGAIEQAIAQVREAGKTGLISDRVVQESIEAIEDFQFKTLDASGALKQSGEEGKEAFDQQITSLRQALTIGLQQGRNTGLEERADKLQREIGIIDETINRFEELQRAGQVTVDITQNGQTVTRDIQDAIDAARGAKTALEDVSEAVSELRQDTEILPDPVTLFSNAIRTNETKLTREQARITLNQQRETQQALFEFIEARNAGELVKTRELEAEKASIRKAAIEQELADINESVAEIEEIRASLSESELERAEAADDQLRQLQTRQAQKQIELFEAVLAEQQRIREEAERDIRRNTLLAENAINTTTNGLKEQQLEYDRINRLLEFQGNLLSENQNVLDAQTDSAVSGLEFLAETARGERRQAQFAEAAAAVRLKAVEEQVKFERISLAFEQQKTQLALEREAIAARISTLESEAGLAQAQAELETALLPGSEANEAEVEARRIAVESAALQLRASQQAEDLTRQQLSQQGVLAGLQRQAFEAQAQNRVAEAERSFVGAIASPSQRRQATRALQERDVGNIASQIGIDPSSFNGLSEFARELRGASRLELQDRGLLSSSSSSSFLETLEAFVPAIADLTGQARQQAIELATRQVIQAGELSSNTFTPSAASGQRFNLQAPAPTILQQALAPVQSTLGAAAEGIGKATDGFNALITEIRALATKPTFEVNVNANGATASATGVSSQQPDLDRVLSAARRFAANGLF